MQETRAAVNTDTSLISVVLISRVPMLYRRHPNKCIKCYRLNGVQCIAKISTSATKIKTASSFPSLKYNVLLNSYKNKIIFSYLFNY